MNADTAQIDENPSVEDVLAAGVREVRAYFDTGNYIDALAACEGLLARHPDSGVAVLYASPLATHDIVGVAPESSRDLFAELFEVAVRPERIYAHAWSPGDFLVWDTLATLHRRDAFDGAGRRLMRQMSTHCTAPLEAA